MAALITFAHLSVSSAISLVNSATDPGNGSPYWNRDIDNFVQFLNLPALPGDYSNNGTVDAADYTVWRDKRGSSTTLPNDLTPGNVGDDDYGVWKSNFGNSNIPGSGAVTAATVPEPAALLVCVCAGVAMVAAGGRTRKRDARQIS